MKYGVILELSVMILIALLALGLISHPDLFCYASLIAVVGGAVLLVVARWPLYRQRRFFEFGNKDLDRKHWMMCQAAYLFLWIGICFALVLLLILRRMA